MYAIGLSSGPRGGFTPWVGMSFAEVKGEGKSEIHRPRLRLTLEVATTPSRRRVCRTAFLAPISPPGDRGRGNLASPVPSRVTTGTVRLPLGFPSREWV